jgi:nitrite reductase/ring-hydroxylating ferredoxin subunit
VGAAAGTTGPDFSKGVSLSKIPAEGMLQGHVGDEPVLLSRLDGELFAVGGACTHYGGALGDGVTRGGSVRCPLHHACFDLRTGAVLRAPALDPLDRWKVESEGDRAFVRT